MYNKLAVILISSLFIAQSLCFGYNPHDHGHHHHDHHDHHHHAKFLNPHAPHFANHKTNKGPNNAFPKLPESCSDDFNRPKAPLKKDRKGKKDKLVKKAPYLLPGKAVRVGESLN